MKTHTPHSSISNLKSVWLSLICLSIAILCLSLPGLYTRSAQADNEHEEKSAPPLVALLSPHDGAALNAPSLHIQAIVAAFKPQRNHTFVFNGQTVTGRNSGQVNRVNLALDGVTVQSLDTRRMGRQIVADFQLDLSKLADGLHLLTVTAFQGEDNVPAIQNATFTLDRTLVAAQVNRIERAATPQPFAAFAVRSGEGEDNGDDRDDDWRSLTRLDLSGTIMLGHLSDGIDLSKDRLVIALGSHLTVLEPGKLRCQGRGEERACRYEDRSQPLLQLVELRQGEGGRWGFRLRGKVLPSDAHTLYLRIGDDWGGIDLVTGERLVGLRPSLDTAHQMQSLIGKDGGSIETVDQAGVIIRLEIPAGALTQDTLIKLTPLSASSLADSSKALHPGVKFEPEGLSFAQPATLTFDFSNTSQTVSDKDSIYLLTSPLTTLPLFGSVDTAHRKLTALLRHFSEDAAGPPNGAFADLLKWANSVLASNQNLTQAEMENLSAVVAQQQKLGCTTDCIDPAVVAARTTASLRALVAAKCGNDVGSPSEAALTRYEALETLAQSLGANVPEILTCEAGVMDSLIDKLAAQGIAAPFDNSFLQRLVALFARAQALGLTPQQTHAHAKAEVVLDARIQIEGTSALAGPTDEALQRVADLAVLAQGFGLTESETLAWQKLDAALRVLFEQGRAACQTDSATGNAKLERALHWATVSPHLSLVDPALEGDLNTALADCTSGASAMTAVVLGDPSGNYNGPTELLAGISGTHDVVHKKLLASLPLPASDSVTHHAGSISYRVEQVGGVLALDGSAVLSDEQYSMVYALVTIELHVTRPGHLRAALNRTWGEGATSRFPELIGPDGSPFNGYDAPAKVYTIPSAGTYYLRMAFFLADGLTVHSGSGRIWTFTFHAGLSNTAPTASSSTAATDSETPVAVPLAATDAEHDPIEYAITATPAHGSLSGTAPNLVYTPEQCFGGTDSFTFTATDGILTSAPATVSIVVQEKGHPLAFGGSRSTPPGTAVSFVLQGSDCADRTPIYEIVTQPAHGTLTGTAPHLTYTPAPGFTGNDVFTFRVRDADSVSAPATFTLDVSSGGGG